MKKLLLFFMFSSLHRNIWPMHLSEFSEQPKLAPLKLQTIGINYVKEESYKNFIIPSVVTGIGYFLSRQNLPKLQSFFYKNRNIIPLLFGWTYLLPQLKQFKKYYKLSTTDKINDFQISSQSKFTVNKSYVLLHRLNEHEKMEKDKNKIYEYIFDSFSQNDLNILSVNAEKLFGRDNIIVEKLHILKNIKSLLNFYNDNIYSFNIYSIINILEKFENTEDYRYFINFLAKNIKKDDLLIYIIRNNSNMNYRYTAFQVLLEKDKAAATKLATHLFEELFEGEEKEKISDRFEKSLKDNSLLYKIIILIFLFVTESDSDENNSDEAKKIIDIIKNFITNSNRFIGFIKPCTLIGNAYEKYITPLLKK